MNFFPQTFGEWLGLLTQFIGTFVLILGAAIRWIRGPLETELKQVRHDVDERMKNQGERIGAVEMRAERIDARASDLLMKHQAIEFQITAAAERSGRVDEQLTAIQRTLERYHESRLAEDRANGERTAHLEAMVNVLRDLIIRERDETRSHQRS